MSSDPQDKLRARMARLVDQELVERAGARLLADPNASIVTPPKTDVPPESEQTIDRLTKDVWQLAALAMRIPQEELDPGENLANLGIDSIAITEVMVQISRHFGISVAPTTFFEANSLIQLATILLARYDAPITAHYADLAEKADLSPVPITQTEENAPAVSPILTKEGERKAWIKRQRNAIRVPSSKTSSGASNVLVRVDVSKREAEDQNIPIAVISMEGAFPQSPTLEDFEAHLSAGHDCIEEIPTDRWDWRAVYGDPKKGAFTDVKYGGFVPDVWSFDAGFFNISPREAELMDPQHRLFMECVWSLIEKGGYAPSSFAGRKIGLFLGINLLDYTDMVNRAGIMEAQQLTGLGHAFCPNRLSFLLDIHGPSEVIDSACSSSLLAIHRGVMSIRHEGCEMAIAGGSNLMLSPTQHIMFSKVGMIAPDGRCKTFAADANGYARADGVGAVLLKRLDHAERDGDPILGVIRGSVAHHGGLATSLTAPNPKAQARLIVEAHKQANVDPRSIGMIECHGTGTPLGDPVEVEGLKLAFKDLYQRHDLPEPDKPVIALGSVKSNIGHAETAAGIAGLIKVLCAFESKTRYRTLHCAEPNPLLELSDSPFFLLQEAAPWPRAVVDRQTLPRRAGISSFGAGGTNVHIVVEEYHDVAGALDESSDHAVVVPISAKTDAARLDAIKALASMAKRANLKELAYTLQVGRDAMRYRAAFVVKDMQEFESYAASFIAGDASQIMVGEAPRGRQTYANLVDVSQTSAVDIAAHWVAGGDVDWIQLYPGQRPRRIALPSYPFQRTKFKLPETKVSSSELHLKPVRNEAAGERVQYDLRLSGAEVFLRDHRVVGKPVLPGVAYLELARSVAQQEGFSEFLIRQVVWMLPLEVMQPVLVSCTIERLNHDQAQLEISSVGEAGERKVHAQMRVTSQAAVPAPNVNIQTLLSDHPRHVAAADVYAAFDAMGLHYGIGHRVISDLWVRHDDAGPSGVLAKLILPENLDLLLETKALHPSLMDGALQSALGLAMDGTGSEPRSAALPFSIDEVIIYGNCDPVMWVQIVADPVSERGIRKMNLNVMSEDGRVRVRMSGFLTRVVRTVTKAPLLQFEPRKRLLNIDARRSVNTRQLVLLTADTCDADELQAVLQDAECHALDDDASDSLPKRFLNLANQLLEIAQSEQPLGRSRIQLILSENSANAPLRALSAMLRSIHFEQPAITGLVIETKPGIDARTLAAQIKDSAQSLAGANVSFDREVLAEEIWDEVAPSNEASTLPWRADGVYLITGGVGKLGLILAQDIVAKSPNAAIILCSRKEPDTFAAKWINSLKNVHHMGIDLSDETAVSQMIAKIQVTHGALTGVVHAAGVLHDGSFITKEAVQVAETFAPKVSGVIALDRALADTSLDFFVLFSSISGVLGNPGQVDYAAANAFLDEFAEMREKRRLEGHCFGRTVSIAWPLWRDGGMTLSPLQQEMMQKTTGLIPLESRQGLDAFYSALNTSSARVMFAVGAADQIRSFVQQRFAPTAVIDEPTYIPTDTPSEVPLTENGDLRRLVLKRVTIEASEQLKIDVDDLDPDVELTEYGFDSIGFTQFANRLNERFALELTPTLFFEYPTLDGLANYLSDVEVSAMSAALVDDLPDLGAVSLPLSVQRQSPLALPQTAKPTSLPSPTSRPELDDDRIAIIGISGQFPGAPDIDAFWEVLKAGRDCLAEIPEDRWDWRDYWGDPLSEPGRANVKWGGFIDGMATFDAPFFGVSPPEARMMDPQQRLLLTEAWRVMEAAGYAPSSLAGSKTGVFIGTADTGYSRLIADADVQIEGYAMTGLAPSLGPNRISYFYDFHGPSVAVETACSSSLIAVHRAIEAIRSGHCTQAIVGGINALFLPDAFVGFAKAGMLSPKGRCKPFSADADGYARGEGVGMVFLKPLSHAEKDNDEILAVIRATAENHGGHAASLTSPNPKAQADLLRTAYMRAGIDPRRVTYIEAHGTGTPLGDPIEVEALSSAFSSMAFEAADLYGPSPAQRCAIGSVKSNIGHLELAAGIAGLIKVVLQMQHRKIVKTVHCSDLNPYLKLADSPFYVAQDCVDWENPPGPDGNEVPLYAGVSSFGFGGSNAHVVLEEYKKSGEVMSASDAVPSDGPEFICLSAKTEAQLKEMVAHFIDYLMGVGQGIALSDIAYTLQTAREAFEVRLGFIAHSTDQLLSGLKAFLAGQKSPGMYMGSGKTNRKAMAVFNNDDVLRDAVEGLWGRGRTDDLLMLWVDGLKVDWQTVRRGRTAKRVKLPGYPFTKTVYWIDQKVQKKSNPLNIEPISSDKTFSGDESFFRDHIVNGRRVLPGVVSFELVRAEAEHALNGVRVFELIGHTWTQVVAVEKGDVRLETVFNNVTTDNIQYSITAHDVDASFTHAQGILRPLKDVTAPTIDLAHVRSTASDGLDATEMYQKFSERGLQYGPAHRAVTAIFRGDGIVVARLQLPVEADHGSWLSPSILDGALQAVAALNEVTDTDLAVPYAVRRVVVFGKTERDMWAVIHEGEHGASIDVCDANGLVCVRIEDFSTRSTSKSAQSIEQKKQSDYVLLEDAMPGDIRQNVDALQALTAIAARILEVSAEELDPDAEFGDFGFDSIMMTSFATIINSELGLSLTPADFFEFATLSELAEYTLPYIGAQKPSAFDVDVDVEHAKHPSPQGSNTKKGEKPQATNLGGDDPIVIVGQSCRFPMAEDAAAFWDNLKNGRDCITKIPADRWNWQAIDGDPKQEPGKTNIHWGGFIDGVFEFDPIFFSISPREAKLMDPQQRLMLTHAWKAIEDAGHAPTDLAGEKIGVFIGTSSSGYRESIDADIGNDGYVATGSVPSVGPNRINYFLDLLGPSEPIETACSSSLVALHRAVQAIKAGDCDMALVGGVNTIITPDAHINFANAGMLSPDGRCKTFSSSANGYVRGEGVGMLFLKRQSDAERDGDPILAVVRGTAVNHGGHANSLTAPNTRSQRDLLFGVYSAAGIDPGTVGYIEAHGTGTALGDPVEINALKAAFKDLSELGTTVSHHECWIGSVKTNIGHLELAAGVAGVMKVLKQFEHHQIAPSLHCEEINSFIALDDSPFCIPRSTKSWEPMRDSNGRALPRRAGISSFGFGGVNAHVILEEYVAPGTQLNVESKPVSPLVFVVSARDEVRLKDVIRALLEEHKTGQLNDNNLRDVAYTLQVGRSAMNERLAVVASSVRDLISAFEVFLAGGMSDHLHRGRVDARDKPNGDMFGTDDPEAVAAHWVVGGRVDWVQGVGQSFKRLRLPTYPFAPDIYRVQSAAQKNSNTAEIEASVGQMPYQENLYADAFYFTDHRVRGDRILPGAMSLDLVRKAFVERGNSSQRPLVLKNISWRKPIKLETGSMPLCIDFRPGKDETWSFDLCNDVAEKTVFVRGEIALGSDETHAAPLDFRSLLETYPIHHDPDLVYASYASLGLSYGPAFRAITTLQSGTGGVLAGLTLPMAAKKRPGDYVVHPCMMDAAFHAAYALFDNEAELILAVPVGIEKITLIGPTCDAMWAHLKRRSSDGDSIKIDISLTDQDGMVRVAVIGLMLRLLPTRQSIVPAVESKAIPAKLDDGPLRHAAQQYLIKLVARETEIDASEISMSAALEDYGVDSVLITRLTDELERDFGPLSRTLFFEYQTLEELLGYFYDAHTETLASVVGEPATDQTQINAPEIDLVKTSLSDGVRQARQSVGAHSEPIAIIGVAGRYPGARNVAEFWENLAAGRDCITEVPADRWDHNKYYDPVRQAGKTTGKWGGFIDGHDRFDPSFFNISPREAGFLDPQERLFLQCAWETLEDAGYTRATVAPATHGARGGNVGVFAGVMYEDYQLYGPELSLTGTPTTLSGSAASIANRVSYFFNFQGPSIAVDSMCSSSLTAIHLACDSLRGGSCSVALAGGVNLTPHPNKYIVLSQGRFLSSDGRCASFGADGDGYVPAEGVGAVLLKPLRKAERDGDRIYGVILGSALNHGGKTNGYTVPNPHAQSAVIEDAMEKAGVTPADIGYVEAHGTGTSLGDPIEITSLNNAYRRQGGIKGKCPIGSVKSNIGHAESAAGIAGLTKILLQMQHGKLVPSLHAETLNPNIDFDASSFQVQRKYQNWPSPESIGDNQPRIASLSSFGAGGSNAHFIISDYIAEPVVMDAEALLFPLSARDPDRLGALLLKFRHALENLETSDLHSVAFTLQTGREAFEERIVLIATGKDQLLQEIDRTIHQLDAIDVTDQSFEATSLGAMAKRWLGGESVDWMPLWSGMKPRPISLPTYPFSEDYCWLPNSDEPARQTPKTVEQSISLPLLYVPKWQAFDAPLTESLETTKRLVILCHGAGINQLAKLEQDDVEVRSINAPDGPRDKQFSYYAAQLLEILKSVILQKSYRCVIQVIISPNHHGLLLDGLDGMLRSVSKEHRNIVTQLIAVDGEHNDLDLLLRQDGLFAESQPEIRYIAGHRQVRLWHELPQPETLNRSSWEQDGVFLFVGGGSISRHVAADIAKLSDHPVIWLTGRSPKNEEITNTLRSLERHGAVVRYRSVDVTNAAAMQELVDEIYQTDKTLSGVFLAAGLTHDEPLLNKDAQTLQKVLGPKVSGATNLDAAIGKRSIDFMVLFGSAAGALGNAGQSDYATANAFLARFAIDRNERAARSLCLGRTITIDWPYWRDGGMKMDTRVINAIERAAGLKPIETAPAIAMLHHILSRDDAANVLVLAGDHARVREMMQVPPPEPIKAAQPAQTTVSKSMPAHSKGALHQEIVATIKSCFSKSLGITEDRLSLTDTIDRFGVDSVLSLEIVDALSASFGPLPDTILFEFPTIADLAEEFQSHRSQFTGDINAVERQGLQDENVGSFNARQDPTPSIRPGDKDVAIIAVAGRYPGADTVEAFADILRDGRDCITEVPTSRHEILPRFSERKGEPDASYCKWGGFLSNIDGFDAEFFGFSPRAAELTDPQERLFLQTTWHLFERVGHTRAYLAEHYEKHVGVFVGSMYQQYADLAVDDESRTLLSVASYAGIANRTSFFFDLQGPSVAIDSMCSSGLQAVHQACQSLTNGECKLAVAGGVNLTLHSDKYKALSQAGLVGSEIGSRAFSGGDGYLPAEGVGAVLLKPLAEAERDGDVILGVIKGSRANHAGHSAGYGVPNADAQAQLLEDVLDAAGVGPETIGYVEAAATGSKIGDAIELRALEKVFSNVPEQQRPSVGSVKANIGHAEAASGMAQLTKVLLQFEARTLFPSFGFGSVTTEDLFETRSLRPQATLTAWLAIVDGDQKKPRRATISSFGAGGSNVVMVLEEAPSRSRQRQEVPLAKSRSFIISARTEKQFAQVCRDLAVWLRSESNISMAALAHTLRHGRERFEIVREFVAIDAMELAYKLENLHFENALAAVFDDDENGLRNSDQMLVIPGYPFARETHWVAPPQTKPADLLEENRPASTNSVLVNSDAPPVAELHSPIEIVMQLVAVSLGCDEFNIQPDSTFDQLGVDSMARMRLIYSLEEIYETTLEQHVLETHTTPLLLAEYLSTLSIEQKLEPVIATVRGPFVCRLGEAQKGLWAYQSLYPKSAEYNVPIAFKVKTVNRAALLKAASSLIERYPILNTRIIDKDSKLIMQARKDDIEIAPIHVPKEREVQDVLRQRNLIPFNLEESAFRIELVSGGTLGNDESVVLMTTHHIITDGVSSAAIAQNFWSAYDFFVGEGQQPKPETCADYAAFIAWEDEFIQSDAGKRQLKYWQNKLDGPLPKLRLPVEQITSPSRLPDAQCIEQRLPKKLCAALRSQAKDLGVSLASLYLTGFSTVLYRYTGEEDIVIGVPTLRRPNWQFEQTVGYCANTIALRLGVKQHYSFFDLAAAVHFDLKEGLRNAEYPFSTIARAYGDTAIGGELYQVTFAYQNFVRDEADINIFSRGEVQLLSGVRQIGGASLGVEVQDDPDGDLIVVNYDAHQFAAGTMMRMCTHLRIVLEAAMRGNQASLSMLPLLSDAEVERAIHHWRKSGTVSPPEKSIVEQFEVQTRNTPNDVAIVHGEQQLTYKQLELRSTQIALSLERRGVRKGAPVAVLLERGSDDIAALLAVMKIGAVWVPLDPQFPDERITYVVQDAEIQTVLSRGALAKRLQLNDGLSFNIIDLDVERHGFRSRLARIKSVPVAPDDPAYIIYTSGSTGTPKGVVISQGALTEHCHVMVEEYALSETDNVLQFASTSVDTSLEQILPILSIGGTLVLRPSTLLSAAELFDFLVKQQITVADLPPAYLHEVLQSWQQGTVDLAELALRLMIVGGEILTPDVVSQWMKAGLSHLRLINAYGPTEATISSLVHTVERNDQQRSVPIGRPLPGVNAFILDAEGNLVPDGVVGELYLGGNRLALGYFGRPDMTDERFTTEDIAGTSYRLYRTGDLARFRPNSGGVIEFHGRIDDQVKIRGYRVELGEIEVAMAALGIADVAVVNDLNAAGDPVLIAFVGMSGGPINTDELRSKVASRLPSHMVPSLWVQLEKLPKTSSGKINRQALAGHQPTQASLHQQSHQGLDLIEAELLQIWRGLFGMTDDQPGLTIHSNFSEVGGHSLLAVRLLSRIEAAFGKSLSVADLQDAQTIRNQAELLRKSGVKKPTPSSHESVRSADAPLVVLLQPSQTGEESDSEPPIFLIHPISGMLACYQSLVRELGVGRDIYGVRARGLEVGETAHHGSFLDMADVYVQEIQKVQRVGPYVLCGWSFGGNLACEVGRRLASAGQHVAFVGMIDSYHPDDVADWEAQNGFDDTNAMSKCRHAFLRDVFGVEISLVDGQDVVDFALTLPQVTRVLANADRAQLTRLFDVFSANYMAFFNADVVASGVPTTLVRATVGLSKGQGVDRLISGDQNMDVIEVAADHYTVMYAPNLNDWAPSLRAKLEQKLS